MKKDIDVEDYQDVDVIDPKFIDIPYKKLTKEMNSVINELETFNDVITENMDHLFSDAEYDHDTARQGLNEMNYDLVLLCCDKIRGRAEIVNAAAKIYDCIQQYRARYILQKGF